MTIAAILAGGTGSRMGAAMPKQYLDLGGKPVILRTAEPFLRCGEIDQLLVLVPEEWLSFTKEIFEGHSVTILPGGSSRNDTLRRALLYIKESHGSREDHILVTHDAVRPFVTQRMLRENIAAARAHGACGTVIPATDTIVRSFDGAFLGETPPREQMYQAQTPQSFRCNRLRDLMDSLRPEEEALLTDGCQIFSLRGEPVALVQGDVTNFKITYPHDLDLARVLFLKEKNEKNF